MLINVLLKNEMPKFDFSNPATDPIELAHTLARELMEEGGVGLAANQLGLPYRAFVIKASPIIVAFNPKIVDYLGEEVYLEEGCLSFPGLVVKIKRPEGVRVRFTQPNGETITQEYHGITSRTFQHELDHLDGVVFYERANRIHRDRGFKNWKNYRRKHGLTDKS